MSVAVATLSIGYMIKVPIRQTLTQTFDFVFGRPLTLLRLTWVPALLSAGVGFVLDRNAIRYEAAGEGDPESMGLYVLMGSVSLATALFLNAVAGVAVTREVFAPGTATGLAYFPTGRTEWRLFLANLRLLLALVVLGAIAFTISALALVLAGVDISGAAPAVPTLATTFAGIVSMVAFVYVFVSAVRMGFFLPATIVRDPKGGLYRAHELSVGSFSPMLVILIVALAPILALLVIGQAALLVVFDGAAALQQPRADLMRDLQATIQQHLIIWEIFGGLVFILTAGMFYGATAYAYQAIAAPDSSEVPPA